mmetsp:Transcript_26314/g.47734  ORF Transcript_26314/g.47734 Transcript_26314/m.47734 type:complete len:590 (-) Transcript_26314:78-1847(-)
MTYLIKLLTLAFCLSRSVGQEKESILLDLFDYSVTFRQSVCDRQREISNGTRSLGNALEGLNLNTFLAADGRYFSLDESGAIDALAPGLIADLMDGLASRGRFTWRNSFGIINGTQLPENRTYDELLTWSAQSFDVSAVYWTKSISRLDRGVSFPEGFIDASVIMIGFTEKNDSSLNMWSFLEPFSTTVWIMIIVTIFFSAAAYQFLDWCDHRADALSLGNDPAQNLFLTAMTFTGNFEFQPATNVARLFAASLAFWALIVTSAYTANLASFLVVQNTPAYEINDLGDAVKNSYSICVVRSTITEQALKNAYPGARAVEVESETELFSGLREGICKIALTTRASWDEYQSNRDVNGDCQLAWIGRTFLPAEGGFATQSDSGVLCTSLVRDVLNLHLLEMTETREVERLWKKHLQQTATINCAVQEEPEEDDDTTQLSIEAMGGTFIVHFILTSVAVFVAAFHLWCGRFKCTKMKPQFVRSTQGSLHPTETTLGEQNETNGVSSEEVFSKEIGPARGSIQQQCEEMINTQNQKLAAMAKQNTELLEIIKGINTSEQESKTLKSELDFPPELPMWENSLIDTYLGEGEGTG